MIKEARKPSLDPAQEKLRQAKAVWNKEVSSFLNDVIHAKKLMNGWPSKFFKERSKITGPIPADPTTILGALAGDFQELAQRGAAIVQQQLQYSQSRRQKQPKAPETLTNETAKPAPAASTTPTVDLSKQLAAWEQKYSLVVEGSNPFSRFLARVKTPGVGFGAGAQERRLRMDMLKACVRSYRALSKVQVFATKSTKASVVETFKYMKMSWDAWSLVSRSFNTLVNSMPDQPARPEDMKEEHSPGVEPDLPAKPIASPAILPIPQVPVKTLEKFKESTEKKVKSPPIPASPPPPPMWDSKPPIAATAELEVLAQAFLKKWLGKTRHQMLPGKSSGIRLQVYQVADKARKDINSIMDLLEKGLDVEQLSQKIPEVSMSMNTLRSLMRSLYNVERPPTKGTPPLEGVF